MGIRFNNLDEFDFGNENYIIAEDKLFNYVEAKLVIRNISDKYKITNLIKFGCNILFLNQNITVEELIKVFLIQKYLVKTFLPVEELTKICVYLHNKHVDGTLIHNNKGRRVLFNPNSTLTGKDRSILTLKLMHQLRKKQTIDKISNLLDNWNYVLYGKCTGTKIVKLTKLSKKTVLLYLKDYKEIVNEINNNGPNHIPIGPY